MKRSMFAIAGVLLAAAASVSARDINDAQIASIVVTANQVDIDAGKLAATRATDAEVKKFAQLMVTDHTGVNKSAVDLATKLKVTPEDNPTSQNLKAGGDANLTNLKGLKGAAFDRAYVDHEVAYHQAVLDAVDQDAHPRCEKRGTEGPARQSATGLRGASRTREAHTGDAQQVGVRTWHDELRFTRARWRS